jgi:outer membrane protein assembly factor BamA
MNLAALMAYFGLGLSLLFPAAAAQKHSAGSKASPVSAYKLIGFKVTGTGRYTDKEIFAASGLQLGQSAADGDFKEAVKRLGDTGLFTNVAYTYSSSSAGTKLELQITDIESAKLVPAHFDNFVWFTDNELDAALQKRVPLFKGLLPVGGNLANHVSEALQALFNERQLPGHINFMRESDGPDGTLSAIDYRVEELSIRIHSVEFPGASSEQSALLTAAARRVTGAEYGRTALAAAVKFDFLPIYLQRGYLRATFAAADARVLPQPPHASSDAAADAPSPTDAPAPAEIEVDVIEPVTPGKIYVISELVLRGYAALSANQLRPVLHLTMGQPANAVKLLRDLEDIRKLYRSRGYMTAQIKTDTQFDDDKSTVRYSISVSEGDPYKMGEVEILGLDSQSKARMQNAWTLHAGQPYNADYPNEFLEETRNLVPTGVQWMVTVHETPDASDKTVDVEIRFKQP